LILLLSPAAPRAADNGPVYKWKPGSEFYFIMPTAQRLYLPNTKDNEVVRPWGVGFRSVGSGDMFSTSGALQIEHVGVEGHGLAGTDSFYLLEMLLGGEYLSPAGGGPLRFNATASGDFGVSDTSLFMAPVVTAGVLYAVDTRSVTPTGFSLALYYRFADIHLSNVGGGRSGVLRPALGIKLGYLFEGFWAIIDKKD
jgi:hypothetical protein